MKKELLRIIISALLFINALILKYLDLTTISILSFLLSYIIVGYDVLFKAVRNIIRGKVFDENFLMSLATIGAVFVGEYPEAVGVMLFYQIGELFQDYAVNKSRKSISELMDIRPDYANIKKEDKIEKVDPYDVNVGDIIIVSAGEKIPLDGIIIDGSSMLDTSALTGESMPREVQKGSDVLSGSINLNGVLTIEVTKPFEESTVSKILDLVENASNKKSKSENFISKFAAVYTPIVVIAAVILAFVPPLLINGAEFKDWIYRALTFLVVSCPCALVISIPLSFFGGIGGASKDGILIKGSNYLENLSKTEIIVFDKTGTLTEGVFEVRETYPVSVSSEKLLELAAFAEYYSNHPISLSLKKAYGKEIDNSKIQNIEEISGFGIKATIDGNTVLVGNSKLMHKMNIDYSEKNLIGTVIHVALENKYIGYILISDKIKEDSHKAISNLKSMGIKKTIMLTGDSKAVGEKVAKELNLDEVYTELLPTDKVEKLESILNTVSPGSKLAFVGDGINDAPVLARADIGFAMGAMGSDSAIEAADIVIMTDEPSKISDAIKISKKTLRIVNQNIIFALTIKIGILILAAFGLSNMWAAVFADVGVAVLAILNALRCLSPIKY